MRTLLACALALCTACGSSPAPGAKACDLSAALSLALTVTDASGSPVDDATARWTAGSRSDDCQRAGEELQCGWEVAGAMSVVVSAPGFTPKTVEITIPQGECHVVPQKQTVVLERKWFAEERRYVHTYFPTQEACTEAQNGGRGIHCCATLRLGVDGRADLIVTDIMNSGGYRLEADAIVFTRETPGDVPDTVRFAIGADGTLTDDVAQRSWKRPAGDGCY